MAQTIRFAIFVLSAYCAGVAFFTFNSFWALAAPVAIFIVGSLLAEYAFSRLASSEEKRGDLEDRVRNPPT
ncbi:hypothetical protein AU467_13325 [Mesorhizobium loti]|uniref:Uncharacterized protein n=1 Tax=Rhizobium loti TaxID=381 RepID=A0A101KWB7_RHILI|nr:hypothetical protein AU467_13325 [Mesorhizobium loti]